jgi:hypothetical protein
VPVLPDTEVYPRQLNLSNGIYDISSAFILLLYLLIRPTENAVLAKSSSIVDPMVMDGAFNTKCSADTVKASTKLQN